MKDIKDIKVNPIRQLNRDLGDLLSEHHTLLRVARAAKEMTDIHHVSGGVRVCPVTTQILDALKELPEGLLD